MEFNMQIASRGLSLIELLVVITIISVLATVGYPSYKTYLMESRRTDAINALRENQLTIEKYMQQSGVTPTTSAVTLLTTSAQGFYDLTYTRVDDDSYKLVATAVSGRSQANDTDCTTITLISEMDNIYPTACH